MIEQTKGTDTFQQEQFLKSFQDFLSNRINAPIVITYKGKIEEKDYFLQVGDRPNIQVSRIALIDLKAGHPKWFNVLGITGFRDLYSYEEIELKQEIIRRS